MQILYLIHHGGQLPVLVQGAERHAKADRPEYFTVEYLLDDKRTNRQSTHRLSIRGVSHFGRVGQCKNDSAKGITKSLQLLDDLDFLSPS